MDRLGPFGPAPGIAVGVSGGADSSALALLADGWARARGGQALALVVDHRLRAESEADSLTTVCRLMQHGIAARRLVLDPPPRGPDISAAARAARHAMLGEACARESIAFLLLAHTRADQAETLLWRALRGSGSSGLAGMAARRETFWGAVLRPLLDVPPAQLRATCRAAGLAWIEDPTNHNPAFARPRLRVLLADPAGQGPAVAALARATRNQGLARAAAEAEVTEELASAARIFPEGFALVAEPGALSAGAAQRLVRAVGGLGYPPDPAAALALVRRGSGTLEGVQASAAGRLGPGIVLAREPASAGPPVRLQAPATCWDGRWRIAGPPDGGLTAGALGAARVPGRERLPARLAAVLPAIRGEDGVLLAVPALGFQAGSRGGGIEARFAPPEPLGGAGFLPAMGFDADFCRRVLQGSAG